MKNMAEMKVCIGIDVGGTNTDAVVLYDRHIVAKCKHPTTLDATLGVQTALSTVLGQLAANFPERNVLVSRVNIGTTHFLNAVLQRKDLVPVAVIRLCGPASRALPPFCDFPSDLKEVLCAGYYFVDGGYEFDGEEIKSVRREEVLHVISQLKREGTKHIVVSGIFSSLAATQENFVGQILGSDYPDASFTLSHQVANMGLLERENSSILNESLKAMSRISIAAFTKAVRNTGLQKCPIFFTQNDGTVISAEKSSEFPVLTFSSGPTNSMRGAAFLSNNKDAIVVDIGGTSTDVGVLQNGFPREASTRVKCGGVTTNFRMPDVVSIAFGGGSIVRKDGHGKKLTVGPDSVGYELVTKSLVYGGQTLTATDIAVAGGICKIGEPNKVDSLDTSLVGNVLSLVHELLENGIDQVKVTAESQPVILVGGGSALVDTQQPLAGASVVLKPEHFEVANAVGAALSQVSGTVDQVVNMADTNREEALRKGEQLAVARAIENGAQPDTVAIVEKTDVKLSYLKGNATRIVVKAVGDLISTEESGHTVQNPLSGLTKSSKDSLASAVFSDVIKTSADQHNQIKKETKSEPKLESVEEFRRPFVEQFTGDWLVSEFDLECIATGAGILGCGGGGSPYLGLIGALCTLKSGKKIRIIHPDNVPKKGLVVGAGFMGAPSVLVEKLFSGHECRTALDSVQGLLLCDTKELELGESQNGVKYAAAKDLKMESDEIPDEKRIAATMSFEIGGFNSIIPLILGAELDLPVVDCDGMGRAFPELQMFTPSIYGLPLCPGAAVGSSGYTEVFTDATTAKALENHLREVVVTKMGCSAGLAMTPLTAEQISRTCVKFSMSRAWHLGYAVKTAQTQKRCPVQAVLDVQNGKLLMSGKVIDVERKTEGGFNRGHVKVAGFGDFSESSLLVSFQNENLLVEQVIVDGTRKLLASTPDLISLIDSESGEPIPTEEVRYGLRVSVIVLPCSPLLTHDKALEIVSPQAFGYSDHVYKPVGVYKQCDAIPLPKFPQV